MIRPVENGMIRCPGLSIVAGNRAPLASGIIPYPTGRLPIRRFPGISCLATIISSISDKHSFSAKLRQAAQDPESKHLIPGRYCHRDSMNKPIKENWTTGDISGFGFAFSLILLGTIVSAYSDHPVFWLLVGTGPLVIALTVMAFLRHLLSVRRGLAAPGRNTKMAGLSWLNGLYRKENNR